MHPAVFRSLPEVVSFPMVVSDWKKKDKLCRFWTFYDSTGFLLRGRPYWEATLIGRLQYWKSTKFGVLLNLADLALGQKLNGIIYGKTSIITQKVVNPPNFIAVKISWFTVFVFDRRRFGHTWISMPLFEPTRAYAWWAHMHRFLSICLWLDQVTRPKNHISATVQHTPLACRKYGIYQDMAD